MQALNFNKGCYIGQEIVERIRSRGQVHRKFTGFEFLGSTPSLGKFEADSRSFAELTSVASVQGQPANAGSDWAMFVLSLSRKMVCST